MKRLSFIALLMLALSASALQAKFFVGIEGGIEYARVSSQRFGSAGDVSFGSSLFYKEPHIRIQGFSVNLNIGTQHSINKILTLRWILGLGGASYGVHGSNEDEEDDNGFGAYLGVDTLLNFINSNNLAFGLIAGTKG